jgi:DNA-binding MarR family transcriptional regulator/N-acetylglutamate synthase-like GNAT family acetyltransferase
MATELAQRVDAVRRFNRFYTREIGVLNEGLLDSPLSLTEARVLFELARRGTAAATDVADALRLDPGYLSRLMRTLRRRRLLVRRRSPDDGRRSMLSLTEKGRATFARLDQRSQRQTAAMLKRLAPVDQSRVVDAMRLVEGALGPRSERPSAFVLRPPQAGDFGWIVHRHGALYSQEFGYDERFEALVARIVADIVERFDPRHERCWIAEAGGMVVGSVCLVRKSKTVARLRLLLVEPRARGLGIGQRLVLECVRFARQAGYRKITLWTHGHLLAAKHLYKQAGFRLVAKERQRSFGRSLVDETWELEL